ncbi:MAG: methyl-accepting chemotaxis protein [Oscillospiraceae bacterium]|nr:methyl-accepting chemotaxis protein [Oscillospiraceae bacterium]
MLKSLGLKISALVTLIIVTIVVCLYLIMSSGTDNLVDNLIKREVKTASGALTRAIEEYEKESISRAAILAKEHEVVEAVLVRDVNTLNGDIEAYREGLDAVSICDSSGTLLAGDEVLSQTVLASALKSGDGASTIARKGADVMFTQGSYPITGSGGEIIGAVVCGYDFTKTEYVDEVKIRTDCEATIFAGDTRLNTTLVGEDGNRVVGTKASAAVIDAVINNRQDYTLIIELFGSKYSAYYTPLIREGDVIGMLFVGVNVGESISAQEEIRNEILLIAFASGVVGIAAIFVFSIFSVSRPLKKIGAFAEKISSGNIGISSAGQSSIGVKSKDEVGVLAKALERAYTRLQGYVGEINTRMQGLVEGDLVTESSYAFQGDFILIKDSINSIVHSLNQVMTEVDGSANQVSSGAKQIADGASSLSQGAIEQTNSIAALSETISNISEKTKKNADVAKEAANLSDVIKGNAETGNSQMKSLMEAVKEINEASGQIRRVIKIIDDIAFQTNILALNAAVEAARAGQHGKGFAVVAEEVRNLAAKSADAAKDTGALIENSIDKANYGLKLADETSASLKDIVDGINRSAEIIAQIAESSNEQTADISHVNEKIENVALIVRQSSGTAQESAAASEEMSSQSDVLTRMISHFKLKGGL